MDLLTVGLGSRLVPYAEGRRLQDQVHAQVASGARPATLIAVEHEPVYTVGRRARSWERPAGERVGPQQVPVVEADRGGKVTWHGPGQLTAYPVVRLRPPIDVIAYVRALEAAVMDVCAAVGLATCRVEGRSGVWVGGDPAAVEPLRRRERKVCALGVRVARGTTLHGVGLNVCPDLSAFDLDRIVPCGIDDAGVTSLAAEGVLAGPGGAPLSPVGVVPALAAALEERLRPLVADPTA